MTHTNTHTHTILNIAVNYFTCNSIKGRGVVSEFVDEPQLWDLSLIHGTPVPTSRGTFPKNNKALQ